MRFLIKKKIYILFLVIFNVLFADDKKIDISFLIPRNDDLLYCIGSAKEEEPILSIDTANAKARIGLANFVKEKLKEILQEKLKSFNAIEDILEYQLSINNITNEVYNLVLKDSKEDKNYFDKKKGNIYYVVVVFELNILKENFQRIIRNNSYYLIKLKMNRPLDEFIVKLKELTRIDFYNDNFYLIVN